MSQKRKESNRTTSCNDDIVSNATINDLVDDCLWYVLEWLNLEKKVGVVRVCKRWQNVISEIIQFKETKLVFEGENDFDQCEWLPLNPFNISKQDVSLFNQFQFDSVRQVDIVASFNSRLVLKLSNLRWLFSELPQLNYLRLHDVFVNSSDISCEHENLQAISVRLEKLSVSNRNDISQLFITHWLSQGCNLKQLVICNSFNSWRLIPKKCPNLESLSFEKIPLKNVFDVISGKPRLKELRINDIDIDNSDLNFDFLAKLNCSDLEVLDLSFNLEDNWKSALFEKSKLEKCFQPRTSEVKNNLQLNFKKLKRLALSNFTTTPNVFETMLESIPTIKDLSLHNFYVYCLCESNENSDSCRACRSNFLEKITILKELEKLDLWNVSIFDDEYLQVIADLLEKDNLPKLRKFMYSFDVEESLELLLAFWKHAKRLSKKSFFAMTMFESKTVKEFKSNQQYEKPRNLFFTRHAFLVNLQNEFKQRRNPF